MVKKMLLISVLVTSSLFSQAFADESIISLKREINARNAAILEMQNTINSQAQSIRVLQGAVDDMAHQISTLNENQKVLYAEIESLKKYGVKTSVNAVDKSEKSDAKNIPPEVAVTHGKGEERTAKVVVATNGDNNADADKILYNEAYKKMTDGNYAEATKIFQKVISTYNNSQFVPNSYYWLGQMQYREKKYTQAKENFLYVTKYKDSQKRADSIYKLGMISVLTKDTDKAKKYFQLVIKQYPQDTSAVLAQKELAKLK